MPVCPHSTTFATVADPYVKLAGQFPVKMPDLVAQPHGGALLSGGVPGHVGGSGRPPAPFTNALKLLRDNPKLHKALETAATDPESKGFSSALKVLTDYDEEKPAARSEVKATVLLGVVVLPQVDASGEEP